MNTATAPAQRAPSRYTSPLEVLSSAHDEEIEKNGRNPSWILAGNILKGARVSIQRHGELPEVSAILSTLKHKLIPGNSELTASAVTDGFVVLYNVDFVNGVIGGDRLNQPATAAIRWLLIYVASQVGLGHPFTMSKRPEIDNPWTTIAAAHATTSFVDVMLSKLEIGESFASPDRLIKVVLPQEAIAIKSVSSYHGLSFLQIAASLKRAFPDPGELFKNNWPSASFMPCEVTRGDKRQADIKAAVDAGRSVRGMNAKPGSEYSNGTDLLVRSLSPKIPYISVIRESMRSVFSGDSVEQTWSRPNRKLANLGIIVPALKRKPSFGGLLVQIDVSSSAVDYISRFLAEIGGIADECRPKFVTLLYVNCTVIKAVKVYPADYRRLAEVARPTGHGGTDMRVIVNWINDPECRLDSHAKDVYDMHLTMSDGESDWPSTADIRGTKADVPHFWVFPFLPSDYYPLPTTGRVLTIE